MLVSPDPPMSPGEQKSDAPGVNASPSTLMEYGALRQKGTSLASVQPLLAGLTHYLSLHKAHRSAKSRGPRTEIGGTNQPGRGRRER